MEPREPTPKRPARRLLLLLALAALPLLGTSCVWAHGCHDHCHAGPVGAFLLGAAVAAAHCW